MTDDTQQQAVSALSEVSNALVALHKSQFGRGPTRARSYFAGPDTLICVLQDALLPAERKLTELGEEGRVRDSRTALQAATARGVHLRDREDRPSQGDGLRQRRRSSQRHGVRELRLRTEIRRRRNGTVPGVNPASRYGSAAEGQRLPRVPPDVG